MNIVDIFSARMGLKRSGKTYFGCCPFHGENLASFYVSESRQVYHCLRCGVTGHAGDAARYFELLDLHKPEFQAI